MPANPLVQLVHHNRGAATLLLAASLTMAMGAATVAVDLGSIYLAKRELQGMTDAAVLAGNSANGRPAAEQLLAHSGAGDVQFLSYTNGHYVADPAIDVKDRFVPGGADGGAGGGATELVLRREVPLFFGRVLVGKNSVGITARAVAARSDAAAFSIGTGLASLQGGLPNALLSGLAGTELNLSVMDYQGLANLNVDVLGFADALRLRLGRNGDSFGSVFGSSIPLSEAINALADTVDNVQSATVLHSIGGRIGGRSVTLSDIVDLGPMGNSTVADPQKLIEIDGFAMLRMLLTPPDGTATPVDLHLDVAGLASTRLMVVTGSGQAHSPMLTITSARDVVIRTAQTRIYLETTVGAAIAGIAQVRVPVYVELAAAEARLSDINCNSASAGKGVTLAVTPAIGTLALADIDTGLLKQMQSPVTPRSAVLAQALGIKVTGYAAIALGGTAPQSVLFTPDDITAHRVRTVSTNDLTQGIAASLAKQTQIQVSILGITTSTGPVAGAVGALLGTTAPAIDGLLNGVTGLLGVKLGKADVQVHRMQCGMSTLVA